MFYVANNRDFINKHHQKHEIRNNLTLYFVKRKQVSTSAEKQFQRTISQKTPLLISIQIIVQK